MEKYFFLFLSLITISSCSLTPPVLTGEKLINQKRVVVAKNLEQIASKCWTKELSLSQDMVTVETIVGKNSTTIQAYRYAPDIGRLPHHIKIIVTDKNSGSKVKIMESPDDGYNQTGEAKTWLNGNKSCVKKSLLERIRLSF